MGNPYDIIDGLESVEVDPCHGAGVYLLYEEGADEPFRVGKAINVHRRLGTMVEIYGRRIHSITVKRCKNERHAFAVECAYIHIYEPVENPILLKGKMPADFWTDPTGFRSELDSLE
jgi:hypothetical protein